MRIAVLGVGRMGRIHAANLAVIDGVSVVVHDPDPARSDLPGVACDVVDSIDDALDGADGVVVATPTALHAEHLLRAGEVARALFAEKPISLDVSATEEVLERLDAVGVPLQVGFQRRFDPGFIEMRRVIDSGEIGDVYLVRTACHDRVPPPESYLETSGSIFKDMHSHDFDAIAWLTGRRIESVFARGSVLVDEMFARHDDVDVCALTLTLEGGVLAVISGARADGLGYDHRTEVFGSRDSITAGLGERTPLRSVDPGGGGPAEPFEGFPDRFEAAYRAEMVAFTELVAGRAPNHCPGRDALAALRVAVAADESLARGLPVAVGGGAPT